MFDSLRSTLSTETVNSFFTHNGKKPVEDELTVPLRKGGRFLI
jgi:hypothetical protein